MSAETIDGGRLREEATRKWDERILLQIADKDCVALEVKYHRRCYQRYTEFVRRTAVTEDDEVRAKCKYEEFFNVFCERFVKEKLIDKRGDLLHEEN